MNTAVHQHNGDAGNGYFGKEVRQIGRGLGSLADKAIADLGKKYRQNDWYRKSKNQAVGVDHKGIAEGLPELFLVDAGHQIYEVVDAFELAHPDAQTRIVPFEGYQKPAHWLIRPQCKPKHHRQQQNIQTPILDQRMD